MTDRTTYIGGGDVASLLGIGYGSPWELWARKVGLIPEPDETLRWRIGRKAERMLAELFAEETGLAIAGEQTELVHPELPYVRGHVDGFVFDGHVDEPSLDAALGLVEHKTDGGAPWTDVPARYAAQAQHYLWITGLERCWFSVMHGRWQYRVYVVERDQADIDFIAERAREFWRLVVDGTPPVIDSSDATTRALGAVYPGGIVDAVELPPYLITEWRRAKQLSKVAADELRLVENELRALLGDHDAGAVDGRLIATLKSQTRKGSLDEVALARVVALEQYRMPASTFRVLRPVKEKL